MQASNVTASSNQNAARPDVTEVRLTNFEPGSSALTLDHMLTLDRWVAPILQAGGSVTINGIDSVGELLAIKRASAVHRFLDPTEKSFPARVGTVFSQSKLDRASPPKIDTSDRYADSEDPLYRAVQISVWMGSTPPVTSRPTFSAHPKVVTRPIRVERTSTSHKEIGGETSKLISAMKVAGDALKISGVTKDPSLPPRREYGNVPQTYTINEVIFSKLEKSTTYTGETVTYSTNVIEYVYGVPSTTVTITRRSAYYYGSSLSPQHMQLTSKTARWNTDGRKVIARKDLQKEIASFDL